MRALVALATLASLLAPVLANGSECYYRVPEDLFTPHAASLFDSCLVSSSILHDDTTATEGGWSSEYWSQFWSAMVDSGATGWTGCAVNLLECFGKGDRDPAGDRIYFDFGPRTGLAMWGYDRTDFCADCDCDPSNGTSGDCAPGTEDCVASPWWCGTDCNPLYSKEVNYWGAGSANGFKSFVNKYQGTRFTPQQAARQQALNHELTHTIHENAVLRTYPQTWDDLGFVTSWAVNYTEFWAPLGEIIGPNGSTQADPDQSQTYYLSLVNDRYGFEQIYDLRRVYWNWIMSNFAGGDFGDVPPDYTDDLAKAVYDQYIVRANGDTLSNQFWDGLGRALMASNTYGPQFEGSTGDQKVQSFVHTFGMARIAVDDSYRDLPLGWPDPDTKDPLDFSFFEDGHGAPRADVIPARLTLGDVQQGTVSPVSWTDPVDGSHRSYDYILPFASDYAVIQADPVFFAGRKGAALDITVTNPAPANRTLAVVVGYLTFDTDDSLVSRHSVEDAVHGDVHNIDLYGNFTAQLSVPDFGGQNKTVVVVITNVPNTYNIPNTLSNSSGGLYGTAYGLKWTLSARVAETRVSGAVGGTWTAANSPYVVNGIATVPADSTLIIADGAEVLIGGGGYLESYGTLQAKGAHFGSNRSLGRFEAIYLAGPAEIDSCEVTDSQFGVVVWNSSAPARIVDCAFTDCVSALYTAGNYLMDVVFENNDVKVPALYDATAVSVAAKSRGIAIRNNSMRKVVGSQHPYRAIHVMACAGADADTHLVIEGNSINGFDYGIYAERLAPRIRNNTGLNCGTGIYVARADASVEVTGNSFNNCLNRGLYAAVDSLYAADNSFRASGLYGVHLADGDCVLRRTDCDSSSVPVYINSHHKNLDLGTMADRGTNGLVPASSKSVSVSVGANCLADTLWACGNYITCFVCGPPPPALPVYCGDLGSWSSASRTVVSLCQPLCRPPAEKASAVDGEWAPRPVGPWFAPNPTAGGGVLNFNSPRAGRARIEALDVSGRLVRRWDLTVERGTTTLVWDGRSTRGVKVGRGVYFFRISAPEQRATVKVVVL